MTTEFDAVRSPRAGPRPALGLNPPDCLEYMHLIHEMPRPLAALIVAAMAMLPAAVVPTVPTSELPSRCEQMPIRNGFGRRGSFYTGCAIRHFQQPIADAEGCRAACCADKDCRSWGLDLRYPGSDDVAGGAVQSTCANGKPCCWLERCTGLDAQHSANCTYGCVSGWTGRPDDPAAGCSTCTAESCPSCIAPPPPPPPPGCVGSGYTPPRNVARTGCDVRQLARSNYSACEDACCADQSCTAWNWDSVLPVGLAPAACKAAGPPYSCCWLKNCAGRDIPKRAGYDSWSGDSGRVPPPPHCPPGEIFNGFHCLNPQYNGTPPEVSHSYDCAMRSQAWGFARSTLPQRGMFKTVYDALQLQRCNTTTAPTTVDGYRPPRSTISAADILLYVDGAADTGGDGSKARPFSSLEAGVDAAAMAKTSEQNVTLVVRAGKYYTKGVVLTDRHSGLTIQNYPSEEVVVTGAVSVPVSKGKWSLHDAGTNTWRLDLSDWAAMPRETFGMRVGKERAIRARFPNGNPEQSDGYSLEQLTYIPRSDAGTVPIKDYFAHPQDWPGVFWLAEPEGGCLPMSGENLGGTGRWYDSAGGGCAGRQAPFGYWCSDSNSRGACPGDYFPHSVIPGGFTFKADHRQYDAARAANWSHPGGAVIHISAGFESAQCLISHVANETVYFDPGVGCDQGPQLFQIEAEGLGWYVDNVQVSAKLIPVTDAVRF
eukprot:SAG11_NODE_2479_length_3311_cov_1.926526_1_plen_710_part_10